ncbi:dUTP diphosphatase [Fluviispira sanaruensis]|uniref:dUTP diphosphatase n=1 Tax=Fluviispira sanaruensis TaxID=2493639 RepID=A0A4V0P265_FLUSA|nr:dUTP diphosphatase [Fluviispira sanaruensis]BBH52147.1 dUTP diphosphatase [Fluviispira sanaruensis]
MLKLEHLGTGEIFYATRQSAGFDICANQELILKAKSWALVKTGLRIVESFDSQLIKLSEQECNVVAEIQLRPRSGLAVKYGISVLNSPSTIDADYRGEIMVSLINHSNNDFKIQPGDRIAQGVCALAIQIPGIKVKDVERGEKGFGSTGRN